MGCCSSKQPVGHPLGLAKPTMQDLSKPPRGGQQPRPLDHAAPIQAWQQQVPEKDTASQSVRVDTAPKPHITEEQQQSPNKDAGNGSEMKSNLPSAKKAKKKIYQYFDISPKVVKKHKVYRISSKPPVEKPYSNLSEWQNLLMKQQSITEEEFITKLLSLRNRNWIQEQIKLQHDSNTQSGGFDSLLIGRRLIQLKEHFNWLVWAVAQFYFHQKVDNNKLGLPKATAKKWSDGFDFKGIHFKLIPYEDAYYIHNEILALKYVQMELLELSALSTNLSSSYNQTKENQLHKDVILPFLSAISYGGFYLYGSPIIFTQELDQNNQPHLSQFNNTLNASRVAAQQNNSCQMQAVLNQSNNNNMSYSYLHNNISPDFVQDSMFKFMPILKNIKTTNMIPIIDFEEYNEKPEDHKADTELKYILVNLFEVLPRLSENTASTIMMRLPCFINEEITFHKFPKNNYIEYRELRRMLVQDKDEEINDEDQDESLQQTKLTFQKKFFSKHNWDFILMYRKGVTSENKRATNFYIQRELPLITKNMQGQSPDGVLQAYGQNKNNGAMLFVDDYAEKDDTFEQFQQQQSYISPQKQSILKRSSSIAEDNKLNGNVLLAAYNYKKEFKLQYSMNNHNYSTNIESLYSASIDQVVKIIESSDNIYNSASLKELFHRKGLNLRFQWVVLTKLRLHTQRELLMIDIILRVMRKIVNEEIKLKSKVQQSTLIDGQQVIEEYYQGNQIDLYKDVIAFYMNTLLKRKVFKHKQVFDETLLGLFLSRMSILGIVYSLNLKKEEFFYLESKDILEDIIDAPSKNPVFFINSVQHYFKIDFKPDILRFLRQDKHLFLSRSQVVTKADIKNIQFKFFTHFSIREQAYFMLARQITNHMNKGHIQKGPGKIKTKSDKDKLKSSFQKPKPTDINMASARGGEIKPSGIGPISLNNNPTNSMGMENDPDSMTHRNKQTNEFANKDSLNTIRQYKNMDRAMNNESYEFNSQAVFNESRFYQKQENSLPLDFSKLSKRNNFKPSQISEIIMPSIMYKLKTYLSNNPMYYFDDSSKIYVGETFTVLKSYYEMPTVEIVDEWIIIIESLLKDVVSVTGCEQVFLEALVYQALLIYFFKSDFDELFKILAKIREVLFTTTYCSPETCLMIQIITGMYFEEKREQIPMEAERSYLTAMMCVLQVYGDPRGRGNFTIPYSLFLSWKLGLLSSAEEKKLHDSEFCEELFDASLKCLFNHKKNYKDQQISSLLLAKVPPVSQSEFNFEKNKFDLEQEKLELQRALFDIKKYRIKPFNITFASGHARSNTLLQKKQQQQAMNVYVSSNHNFRKEQAQFDSQEKSAQKPIKNLDKENSIKSKSQLPLMKKKSSKQQNEYDLDPSEIDLDIEDENKNFFVEENFKNNEWYIGQCPFQHWSIYRQQINQILNAHNLNRNGQAQTQYQKQIYKEMLQKFLPKDQFFSWLIKFNPMMYQSGVQWNNLQIKEIIFCQNQQMVSSSSSSVVLSSHHNMSNQSLSSAPSSAKEKHRSVHLGSYSQILGKEVGGLSKSEMAAGSLFTMGTDGYGQLGLESIPLVPSSNEGQMTNLKVLYPRMVTSLRDEIVKEICCGHSHTLVMNIHGQFYGWGLNENGQLGLGPDAPSIVRKPVLNPYIQNVIKLSAGNEHSLAITKTGDLYVWGAAGLTGLGHQNKVEIPTKMEFFNKNRVVQAVCGGLHTVVITKDGECYSWGSTEGGQLGLPQNQILQICQGQEIPVLSPQKIPKLEGQQIIQIACGEAHTIAMTKEGDLYGWGMSNYGQLGLGFSSDSFEPGVGMEKSKVHEPQQIIGPFKQERVSKIICGATFTLFQTEKGDLYGCGMNDLGQLGLDTFMEDLQIASLEKAKRGKHHHTSDVTVPTKVICFQGIVLHNIACGENHALAVSGDDKNMLWAWGMYKQGQLGLGEVTMKMNPRPVQTLCSSFIQRIACGSMHSLAIIGDPQLVSNLSAQQISNNDVLSNYWQCDIRGMGNKDLTDYDDYAVKDDEVPDDGEGKVKNPK